MENAFKPAPIAQPSLTWQQALPDLLAIISTEVACMAQHNDRMQAMADLLRMAEVADSRVELRDEEIADAQQVAEWDQGQKEV